MAVRTFRKRWPVLATVAVIVGAVGATTVFLVGSAQRRDDRAAYLRYERAALVPIKEGGRIVIQEMRPSLRELDEGKISTQIAIERAAAWRRVFDEVQADLVALRPPRFLGDITRRWVAATSMYRQIADLFERAARTAGSERTRLLDSAADTGTAADKLFDEGARVMQFHRRRLGLGSTASLPDPAATRT